MRPSTVAIYSSQRRCQEAIDELWSFTENKTAEELKIDPSMHILVNLRNNLLLQCSEMISAHRNHDPGDGNANNAASQRLNMIVESTRAYINQVLKELDDKLMRKTTRTPNMFVPPGRGAYQEPYTSLSQFHPVRSPAYLDSPKTQRTLYAGSVAGRNSQEPHTYTPCGRRPDYFTQEVVSRQTGKTTTPHIPTSSSGTGNGRQLGAVSAFTRPTGRQLLQRTPQVASNRPTPDVVLKRSTTTSAYKPTEKWHKTTENYPPRIAEDEYTGKRSPSTLTAKPQQVVTRQILGINQYRSSDATMPNTPITPRKEERFSKWCECRALLVRGGANAMVTPERIQCATISYD